MKLKHLSRKRILAFDPGESTGVVEVDCGELKSSCTVGIDELKQRLAMSYWLPTAYDIWVAEDFYLTGTSSLKTQKSLLSPHRVLSWLEFVIAMHDPEMRLVKQSAANAKRLDLVKKFDWKLGTKHEKDAANHALYYIYQEGGSN